jgi:hypothetical protein
MTELNELLRPTIAPEPPRPMPWRVSSQFWVAFLGGVPAVTVIAYLNARRLRASQSKRRWIALSGVIALIVTIVMMASLGMTEEYRQVARIGVRVIAVVLFLILARIQRDDDRRYQVFGLGQYDSLWAPGILVTVVSAVALVGLVLLVMLVMQ